VMAAWCRVNLPGRSPNAILQVPRMPRDANGAIVKEALIAHALQIQAHRAETAAAAAFTPS
jgi:hypothetical protein